MRDDQQHAVSSSSEKNSRWRFLLHLFSVVIVCGLISQFFLSEKVQSVGDPEGMSISFAVGGLTGLIVFFLVRLFLIRSD